MRRKIVLIIFAALLLVGVAVFLFWRAMEAPLYEPGMVRSAKNLRAPLNPPQQTSEGSFWRVEDDIQLFEDTVRTPGKRRRTSQRPRAFPGKSRA